MIASYPAPSPTPPRLVAEQTGAFPADPARVNPAHLPALAHIASDLDGLTVPVRITPHLPHGLGVCVECSSGPNEDLPVYDAVAAVRATDPYGHVHSDEVCALHLSDVVSAQSRRERLVTVEAPAQDGRQWFERSPRETFYAVSAHDPMTGVAATRGMWDAWQVVEVVDGFGSARVLAPVGLRDGESFDACRERAEVLAQAYAAVLAADAYEAAQDDTPQDAETVELPVVTVERAA